MKEVFVEFLKKSNCYESFKNNIEAKRGFTLDTYLRITPFNEELVGCAFLWRDTEEGHNYWDKVDGIWKTLALSLN